MILREPESQRERETEIQNIEISVDGYQTTEKET